MPHFAMTVQRKLLLLLLTVGFIPAAVGVLYTYYGVTVGFSQVLEELVQEDARNSMRRLDDMLSRQLGWTTGKIESLGDERLPTEQEALADFLKELSLGSPLVPQQIYLTTRNNTFSFQMDPSRPEGTVIYPLDQILDIPPALNEATTNSYFLTENITANGVVLRYHFRLEANTSENVPLFLSLEFAARSIFESTIADLGGSDRRLMTNRGYSIIGGRPNESISMAFRSEPDLFGQVKGIMPVTDGELGQFVTGYHLSRFLQNQRNEGRTTMNWAVISSVDLKEARTVGEFLLWRSILLGVILVPVMLLLSVILAKRFLLPLRQIHASLDRLAEGHIGNPVVVSSQDEFQDLAQAYNRMAERIRQASAELLSQIRSSRRQAREVTLVNDVCQSLAAEFDRERLFETARRRLAEILRHDCLSAVVADPAGRSSVHHYDGGALQSHIHPDRILQFVQQTLRETETPLASRGTYFSTPTGDFSKTGLPHPDCFEIAVLPMLVGEILLGALILGRRTTEPFNLDELQSTRPITRFLAVATQHIQLYERTLNFATELEGTVQARTEQLESAHRQLLQTERFAATGKLAANIAHEINNPLGIIKNYLRIHRQALGQQLDQDSLEALLVMEEEIDRIARIVRRLLDFYRTPSVESQPTDLNTEIQSILALLGSTLQQKGIQVDLRLKPNLPSLVVVPDLIRQVLLNLCKNAEEAMSHQGVLLVGTCVVHEDQKDWVVLEVADTGCGIPAEHMSQIYEPFFTSKSEGQGTGLGLAVTYGIIQGLRGKIAVESHPGLGTRFRVYLPISEQAHDEPCTRETASSQWTVS
jgi:signal transduction histidine kinase